jgi:MFS family permease
MQEKKYRLINNITGWAAFAVAAVTYLMTIEPTASLWDCSEFISSAFKLEIGHPPGNPVFMIMARFFTLFAGGNVSKVAAMVNSMSALASAFAVLFLFWSITHLAKKMMIKDENQYTSGRIMAVMAAGLVGSIAYCFSDSFWFSAVEAIVFASSAFFTALVFWAILKWENVADEKHADRWIILIAFLIGLAIEVHLLNLLTIPAIGLVYYFRKFNFSWKGFITAIVSSVAILALLMYGIRPGVVTIASKFDLFFVNKLGLPVLSGLLFHMALIMIFFVLAIKSTIDDSNLKKTAILSFGALFLSGIWVLSGSIVFNLLMIILLAVSVWVISGKSKVVLNTALTIVMVILLGFSSNAIIVIRASANPPLNENNPSDPYNLLYFLNREQYGDRPLFKGQYFNAPRIGSRDGKPRYNFVNGKYEITSHDVVIDYDPRFVTLFPRMWSAESEHPQEYQTWSKMKGIPIQVTDESGKNKTIRKPTFIENMRFMFSYQIGYMYFRYFMWNFSGRQNDTQGTGGSVNGNWITGINFLDEPRIGTSDMPADMKKDPSRNVYYMLPLLLGIIGLLYHFKNDNKNWWVILLLFFMTGLAIILYLNQYPDQPRERDYAYAGSFYFFAIWIGIGVLALFEKLAKVVKEKIAAPAAGLICLLAVPLIMGSQNWDDHDRSGRFLTRDVAFNYLNSCAPDAILFTNGDNDTFPLWYAQEVEGKRTDVRICNLMLLNTDWYIDEMKVKSHESDPLPITLPEKKYYDGVNNQVYIVEKSKEPVDISTVIEWIKSDNKATKLQISETEELDNIPSRTIRIPVDASKVIAAGVVKPSDADKIVPYIDIKLKGSAIMKSSLMVLDILAHNDWKRPIYFVTGYHEDAMGLEEYFQLEGLAYRLVPIKSENKSWLQYGRIDTDILYNNMMTKFAWGGAKEKGVDIDYNHKRNLLVIKARYDYARLANALSSEGKNEKALSVLDYCMTTFPIEKLSYDMYVPDIIEAYVNAGAIDKATELTRNLSSYYFEKLDYYLKQKPDIIASAGYEVQSAIQFTSQAADACKAGGKTEFADEITNKLQNYYTKYIKLVQPGGK